MIEQNLVLILVLLPFVGAIVAATLPVYARNAAAWVSGLVLLCGLGLVGLASPAIQSGRVLRAWVNWVPSLGLNLSFRMDGFSWLFVGLVLSIGILVVIYARYYLSKNDPVPRFYAFLMAFTGAMLGVLLSGNILMLVVFWELTSVISFLLIGYWYQSQAARDGARQALVITAIGGLCLMVAMLLIGREVGSYDIDRVLAAGDQLRDSPYYVPILILFLLGAFTKSAQFPFHFWLPGAMAAPTPVSAYLHSATMVKAGVFLLIRFSPALGNTELWFYLVAGTGTATLVIGAMIALFRHDLKGLLAYSTISHLGLITALAGIGSDAAILAAIFHLANHAVFKASLFMAAGIIDHETGTRDMRRLSGLMRYMPMTGTLAIVASAAMAGVPLLNGFLSKEMFFAEAVDWHNGTWLDNSLPYLAIFASIFSVAYSLRFIHTVFFGPPPVDLPKTPHEPSPWMRRPVEFLVLVCLVVGILPQTFAGILNIAARAVVGRDMAHMDIAIWHGWNAPMMMSVMAMVVGTFLYVLGARTVAEGPEGPPLFWRLRAQRVYEKLLLELSWVMPRRLHSALGTERLQPQLRTVVVIAIAVVMLPLWGFLRHGDVVIGNELNPAFALMWVVGCACAMGAAYQAKYHRFASLALLGGAGIVTCLTFAWFSAPDLAVTQILVEIVTTVLLLLGLRWLPKRNEKFADDESFRVRSRRLRDFFVALIAGFGMAAVSYLVMTRPAPLSNVGNWFLANAYKEGGGTNVVNVILVDFRAFDTFGEITVLAIVGLTVFGLLRRFRPAVESRGRPEQQKVEVKDFLFVPVVIMRWLFPAMIMLAAYLFMRGHDLPGGGFSAGVTFAIALMLQYIGNDVRWVEARITVLPIRWMGFGLLIAGVTGVGAFAFGYPFLTAHAQYIDLPLLGKVPAATAMLFDLGVFALVVGATVLMLIAIAHQSLRSARLREQDAPDGLATTAAAKETL